MGNSAKTNTGSPEVEHTTVPVPDSSLAVWFTPQAIRSHFETPATEWHDVVANMSDEELRGIGDSCLSTDYIWEVFHQLLVGCLQDATAGKDEAA